jgi:Thymidine kinase
MNLLAIAHNYEELGRKVLLLTPSIDTRSDVNEIASRVGIHHRAIVVEPEDNLAQIVATYQNISCVLVDEGQFLQPHQVTELSYVVDHMNIATIVYGLKIDFNANLFEGSKALLEQADKIEEVKTICSHCGRKATYNARVIGNERVNAGDQIMIGGNDSYIPLCRKCYYDMPIYNSDEL